MRLPKVHFLLHMLEDTHTYGPVDNYSLQAPENQHRRDAKVPFERTSKGESAEQQVSYLLIYHRDVYF